MKTQKSKTEAEIKASLGRVAEYAARAGKRQFFINILSCDLDDHMDETQLCRMIDAANPDAAGASEAVSGSVPVGAKDYRTQAERDYQDSLLSMAQKASLGPDLYNPALMQAGEKAARRLRSMK